MSALSMWLNQACADVTPAQITPPQINPTTINPTVINPTTITPTIINPTIINPTTINPVVINPTVINPTVITPTIINPTTINPTIINPTTINPAVINPPIVRPQIVTPAIVSPSITTPTTITPTTTTPTTTTPTTITPATVTPGNSSAAERTSMSIPDTTEAASKKEEIKLPIGMVVKTQGKVVLLVDNKKIHPLKEKSLFYPQQAIITKKDSKVALRFNDGSFVVLGPESILEIKQYRLTLPAKGDKYAGAPKDRAVLKLLRGNLRAQLGSLALFNGPRAFAILTPRGRIELADAKRNPNVELIYNNKVGLTVRAVGVLSNSKGQVNVTDKNYGLVSAVIGSFPTTTSTLPLVFSDPIMISTAAFFASLVGDINTAYSENILVEEETRMAADAADTAGDSDASNDRDVTGIGVDEEGDDDEGNDIDNDDDDD